jgi:hypothetical protein
VPDDAWQEQKAAAGARCMVSAVVFGSLLVLYSVLDRLCLMMPGKSKKQLQEHDAW